MSAAAPWRRCLLLAALASTSYAAAAAAPLVVLYESWLYLPHSYAIVSCMEIIHLLRLYGPESATGQHRLSVLVREPAYYMPQWSSKRSLAYSEAYNTLLEHGVAAWDGTTAVDVVLRRSYPHLISAWPGEADGVPLLLFYTSERGVALPTTSFSFDDGAPPPSSAAVAQRLAAPRLRLITPSAWSARGAATYGRNATVVPHGVDGALFHRLPARARAAVRARLGFRPSDVVLLTVGAMTPNKGMAALLTALHVTVVGAGQTQVKLMLKAMGDLYDCRRWVDGFFSEVVLTLQQAAAADGSGGGEGLEASVRLVFSKHVLFADATLGAPELNELYNAADLYAAPYVAEAFSLTLLEALRAGLPVLAPRGGGAAEYLAALSAAEAGAADDERFIRFLRAQEGLLPGGGGEQVNIVEHGDVAEGILAAVAAKAGRTRTGGDADSDARPSEAAAARLAAVIEADWSWRAVAERLRATFEEVTAGRGGRETQRGGGRAVAGAEL